MFDFNWSEIALIVIVALVFIGPKDMPVAIRTLGRGIRSLRRMASEFQTHVEDMVREADLGEAREQFRDLKRFDVRGQFMKAIDGDRTIRNSLDSLESKRRDPAPAPGFTPPETMPVQPAATTASVTPPRDEVTGPAILPPSVARRVYEDRKRHHAPSIVPPPRAIHAGHRVALETNDVR